MYISRLDLNLRSANVRHDLNDPYEMHRSVYRFFAISEKKAGRILYRVEKNSIGQSVPLIAVSESMPDCQKLLNESNYLLDAKTRQYDLKLPTDLCLKFTLKANPTKKKNGKRMALALAEQRQAWIRKKAEQNGFQVLDCLINGDFGQNSQTKKGLILNSVLFEGILRIEDSGKFTNALVTGIGSGKAFGFGLLSVAKI